MKKMWIVLLVFAAFVVIIFIYIAYIGFFNKVTIEDKPAGGYKVVGKEFVGAYSKVGKLMLEVDKSLNDLGVKSTKGFGIYYDDPKTVPSDKCRSFVGNVLEEKDYSRIEELKSKGFKVDSIPFQDAVVSYFPIKSNWSYMVGPMKVYPEFSKYVAEKGYKVTMSAEIYDVQNKMIEFIMQYKK